MSEDNLAKLAAALSDLEVESKHLPGPPATQEP